MSTDLYIYDADGLARNAAAVILALQPRHEVLTPREFYDRHLR